MARWLAHRGDRRSVGPPSEHERQGDPSEGPVLAEMAAPNERAVQGDLVRTMLTILFIAGLITTSFWILWPFLPAIIWATTLVVATFPLMLRVQHRLWNSRALAVAVMTLALLLVFVVPFSLAVAAITQNIDRIVGWAKAFASFHLPPSPAWLTSLPLVGGYVAELWQGIQKSGIEAYVAK